MKTDRGSGGRSAFFGLAMLILGGLLFAAGVMVGRQMALSDSPSPKDPLIKIDQRDQEPKKTADGGGLVFPEVLDQEKPEPAPIAPAPEIEPEPEPAPAPEIVPVPVPVPEQNHSIHKFSLQVAAYAERPQAESLVIKLTEEGYRHPRISEKEVPGKGTYYRVRVGPYPSRPEAQDVSKRLEQELRVQVLLISED